MQLTKDKPLFFHYRFRKTKSGRLIYNNEQNPDSPKETGPIYNMGGATVAFDVATKTFGVSQCHLTDNFNKKLGRNIALGRSQRGKDGDFGIKIPYNGDMDFASVKAEADKIANNLYIIP